MALEKSVLSMEKMRDILMAEYGLHLIENHSLEFGTANCFKIHCTEGDFFLKEYQSRFTLSDVEREAELVSFLLSKGLPVARFLKTTGGKNGVTVNGHMISIQEFITGNTYQNRLPHPLLLEGAKYLGMMHRVLKDYPMKTDMNQEWVDRFSAKEYSRICSKFLDVLKENKSESNYERIYKDLIFKKELCSYIEKLKPYYIGITYTPTHGDYSACQLICDEERIKAIIDFSSAASLPAVWEIMRSYMQSSGACREGTSFDITDLVLYVREYLKYFPLSKRDLTAMPYVYLFQLARSLYGYKEYLITKSENRNELIEFAFWRTEVCREIYEKADEISYELGNL